MKPRPQLWALMSALMFLAGILGDNKARAAAAPQSQASQTPLTLASSVDREISAL